MPRRGSTGNLSGHKKVGEHFHRVVYLSPAGHIVKVGKSHREKKYWRLGVRIPMRLQSIVKFGRFSPNAIDFYNYSKYFTKSPKKIADSFAKILNHTNKDGQSVLTMEHVADYTGKSSKTLEETGVVSNEYFWKRFDEVVSWFESNKIPFLGFSSNVMVKWVSPTRAIPVIIDYKAMGWRRYPFQPWLWSPGQLQKKMLRKYERLKQNHLSTQ